MKNGKDPAVPILEIKSKVQQVTQNLTTRIFVHETPKPEVDLHVHHPSPSPSRFRYVRSLDGLTTGIFGM